jgi:N-acetylglucosaminyl-diphospho-decaprenol L-rhamnosyltransferase
VPRSPSGKKKPTRDAPGIDTQLRIGPGDKPGPFRYLRSMSAMPPHMRVTVVSVCYNSMAVVPAMLASVPAGTPVVVVDNSPEADPALATLCDLHSARLIRNKQNLGFGVACNIGAQGSETEFLLFLNPDAILANDTLDQLVAAATRYPAAAAMNPRIANADGSPYFKRRSPLMPRREYMPRGWPQTDREVTVLSGAALFVRRAAFTAVGGFDAKIFLYHEDDDLSRRLRAEVGPIMFIRSAAVTHLAGRSTERTPEVAAFKAFHMGQSRVYAMRKHDMTHVKARALVIAFGKLASPLTWLSARARAKHVAFLQGVRST